MGTNETTGAKKRKQAQKTKAKGKGKDGDKQREMNKTAHTVWEILLVCFNVFEGNSLHSSLCLTWLVVSAG